MIQNKYNSKLKLVPIFYNLKGGNFTGPTIGYTHFEELVLDTYLNLNSINIKINDEHYNMILTTGHSVVTDLLKINDIQFTRENNIINIINGNKFYYKNEKEKDYALIYSPTIKAHMFKIILDKEYVQSYNSLKSIEPNDVLIKNGANTGLSYAKVLLDLSNDEVKNKFEVNKEVINGQTIYSLKNDNSMTLIFNLKLGSKICDYLLMPSDENYQKRTIVDTHDYNVNSIIKSCLQSLKSYFIDCKLDSHQIESLINKYNIGKDYEDKKKFGWVSLQGDSGSGFYKIIGDQAHLIGINIQGAVVINLVKSKSFNDDITWDSSDKKIKIKNWIVESLYKCSVVQSINTIEKFIREDINNHSILI